MKSLSFTLFIALMASIFASQQHDMVGTNQPADSYSNVLDSLRNLKNADKCTVCETVINTIIDSRHSGFNKESMRKLLKELCPKYTEWGTIACNSYVDLEIDHVLFIIDNTQNLTAKRVCAINLQSDKCVDPDENQWVIPLPPEPENAPKRVQGGSELNILQLTDFHYDPLYKPGSNAQCDEPLCCQNGTPSSPENAAGYWGDYNVCDMPWHSVTNLIERIKNNHENIDYVYYTGDIISHTWLTTKEQNIASIKTIYKLFRESFNKTVYPILGNHEPNPTNFYSPENVLSEELSTHWVFDVVSEEWSTWLPESAKKTILKGGYYTVLVKPGFRIIALNSNVCYINNLWLLYNDEDPYGQLKWLVEQLTEAERNGEYVHILSHIPPGEIGCHKQWSNQFRRIVNRFAKTISAQFNGHTHYDELRVFYNLTNSDQVVNVAFNGGSFTTYVGLNPNYRCYSVESGKYTVSDYDHYTFNITQANESSQKSPDWYKLYSFKAAWGLSELTLDNLGKLMKDMKANEGLVQQYYRFLVRDSDVIMKDGCNSTCLQSTLCSITAVETNESVNC